MLKIRETMGRVNTTHHARFAHPPCLQATDGRLLQGQAGGRLTVIGSPIGLELDALLLCWATDWQSDGEAPWLLGIRKVMGHDMGH